MSKALEMLQRVQSSLSTPWSDTDRVNVTPLGRVKLAQLHRDEVLTIYRVSDRLREFVESASDDDPQQAEHWAKVRESAADVMSRGLDGYVGDAEHMVEYCRMLVAAMSARGNVPDDELRRLNEAHAGFMMRHLRAIEDYASTITDTKTRVLAGCGMDLQDGQFDQWLQDIDVFAAKCARHEYTRADALAVRAELERVCNSWVAKTDDPKEKRLVNAVRREFDKITAVAERHALGPAHLEALEHQWRAYRFNGSVVAAEANSQYARSGREAALIGALQGYTIDSLRSADTYCWAPQTTQAAVQAAAEALPLEGAPSASTLGDIATVGRSGWWWFQEPIPLQTTDKPGTEVPVVALLWRYGLQEVQSPPDFPQLTPEPRMGLWLQTFVMQRLPLGGRQQDVAVPTLAWIWHDTTTLHGLPSRLQREYERINAEGKAGHDSADMSATVSSSMAFSRFFIAAAAWLRQKIVIESVGGQIRQAARQLQRQHNLAETPRVRIVELRRSQYVKREDTVTDGNTRKLTCRFVVKGFWRNQWYATRQEHAQIYIESFLKGPADAPLKAAAPTVFVVRR